MTNLSEFFEKYSEEVDELRIVIDTNDGRYFAVGSHLIDEDGDLVITVGEEL